MGLVGFLSVATEGVLDAALGACGGEKDNGVQRRRSRSFTGPAGKEASTCAGLRGRWAWAFWGSDGHLAARWPCTALHLP